MCLFIETLRIEDGKVWHASLHDRRMNDTRRAFFGLVPDLHVMDYLRPETYTARTRCRLTYARDVIRVEYFPYHVRPVHSLQLVVQDDIDYRYKQADRRVLDEAFALRDTADDVLIVRHGLLTDTSIANIALGRMRMAHPRTAFAGRNPAPIPARHRTDKRNGHPGRLPRKLPAYPSVQCPDTLRRSGTPRRSDTYVLIRVAAYSTSS